MALDRSASPTGEQPESFVEQRGDLARPQRADACRRELDRERNAVEAPTDLADRGSVRVVECERGTRRTARSTNSRAASVALDICRRGCIPSDAECPKRPHLLSLDRESLAARGEELHSGTVAEEPLGERAGRVAAGARSCRGPRAAVSRAGTPGRCPRSSGPGAALTPSVEATTWISDSASSAVASSHSHAPSANRGRLGGHLHREPGLAHTADAGQRHEPSILERGRERGDLVLAPDERRELQRQVPRERIEGPQRRKRRGAAPARRPGTPAPVATGRAAGACRGRPSSTPVRERVAYADRRSPPRHSDLTTVRDRHQAAAARFTAVPK